MSRGAACRAMRAHAAPRPEEMRDDVAHLPPHKPRGAD